MYASTVSKGNVKKKGKKEKTRVGGRSSPKNDPFQKASTYTPKSHDIFGISSPHCGCCLKKKERTKGGGAPLVGCHWWHDSFFFSIWFIYMCAVIDFLFFLVHFVKEQHKQLWFEVVVNKMRNVENFRVGKRQMLNVRLVWYKSRLTLIIRSLNMNLTWCRRRHHHFGTVVQYELVVPL